MKKFELKVNQLNLSTSMSRLKQQHALQDCDADDLSLQVK
jgi:hypothetical protein